MVFATLAIGAFFLQIKTLNQANAEMRASRDLSSVQVIKLYLELGYPGEWSVSEGRLVKGEVELPSTTSLNYALAAYLPRGFSIDFILGQPPLTLPQRIHHDRPPPPAPSLDRSGEQEKNRLRPLPDFPFPTESGSGIAVRNEAEEIMGWIALSHDESERMRWVRRQSTGIALSDEDILSCAERIRKAIEEHAFGKDAFQVTVTIGLASLQGTGFEEALALADEALYRGKREGRGGHRGQDRHLGVESSTRIRAQSTLLPSISMVCTEA